MYNSGNSSKNVTGASVVDGTLYTVDIADDAVTADKLATAVNTDIGTGVTASTTAGAALPKAGGAMTGAITTNSTFDGRDVATDGSKLDGIEAGADVTDTDNVTTAGALMDSELAGIAAVKATTAAFLVADETKLNGIETGADVSVIGTQWSGQFSAAGGTTTTIRTFANSATNQHYIISVHQSGASYNSVVGYIGAYGAGVMPIRTGQYNTNAVLDMNFANSGLTVQLVLGSGFGVTTWDWVITKIK
jgi:hypothetical protein